LNEVDRVALKEFNLIQNELLNVSGKLNWKN
jgi:hypothetical protein